MPGLKAKNMNKSIEEISMDIQKREKSIVREVVDLSDKYNGLAMEKGGYFYMYCNSRQRRVHKLRPEFAETLWRYMKAYKQAYGITPSMRYSAEYTGVSLGTITAYYVFFTLVGVLERVRETDENGRAHYYWEITGKELDYDWVDNPPEFLARRTPEYTLLPTSNSSTTKTTAMGKNG